MIYQVVLTQRAQDQLLALYDYIRIAASPIIAESYVNGIASYCASLNVFPQRGTKRDDLQTGVRVTHYKKRCVIAFKVFADTVVVLGIFYGGQNYEEQLTEGVDDE